MSLLGCFLIHVLRASSPGVNKQDWEVMETRFKESWANGRAPWLRRGSRAGWERVGGGWGPQPLAARVPVRTSPPEAGDPPHPPGLGPASWGTAVPGGSGLLGRGVLRDHWQSEGVGQARTPGDPAFSVPPPQSQYSSIWAGHSPLFPLQDLPKEFLIILPTA